MTQTVSKPLFAFGSSCSPVEPGWTEISEIILRVVLDWRHVAPHASIIGVEKSASDSLPKAFKFLDCMHASGRLNCIEAAVSATTSLPRKTGPSIPPFTPFQDSKQVGTGGAEQAFRDAGNGWS